MVVRLSFLIPLSPLDEKTRGFTYLQHDSLFFSNPIQLLSSSYLVFGQICRTPRFPFIYLDVRYGIINQKKYRSLEIRVQMLDKIKIKKC